MRVPLAPALGAGLVQLAGEGEREQTEMHGIGLIESVPPQAIGYCGRKQNRALRGYDGSDPLSFEPVELYIGRHRRDIRPEHIVSAVVLRYGVVPVYCYWKGTSDDDSVSLSSFVAAVPVRSGRVFGGCRRAATGGTEAEPEGVL